MSTEMTTSFCLDTDEDVEILADVLLYRGTNDSDDPSELTVEFPRRADTGEHLNLSEAEQFRLWLAFNDQIQSR